jgi:uncharacterized protein (DUF4415 family)
VAFYDIDHSEDEERELLLGHSNQGKLLLVVYTLTAIIFALFQQDVQHAQRQKTMREEEYDLKTLKVKRRGILPGLQGQEPIDAKLKITIALDEDLVDYFKAEAQKPEALPYQTQINQTLRQAIWQKSVPSLADTEAIKMALLQDSNFIREMANKIGSL